MSDETTYRDRIKELRRVPASELIRNSLNWRKHPESQQTALRGVLGRVGYALPVVARERPDGSLELLDGHLRSDIAGDSLVPVVVLDSDVTDEEAKLLLALIDPIGDLAETEFGKAAELLESLEASDASLLEFINQQLSKASAGMVRQMSDNVADEELLESTGEVFVQFTSPLTAEQDKCLRAAIRDAKKNHSCKTTGEALALISAAWNVNASDNDAAES